MKTAEEFFQQLNGGKSSDEFDKHNEYISAKWAVEMIERYARQACKAQREICFFNAYEAKAPSGAQTVGISLHYQNMTQKEFRDTIINAPEPDLN